MNLSRRQLDVILFGVLFLLAAYIVRGWIQESEGPPPPPPSEKAPPKPALQVAPVPVPVSAKDSLTLLNRVDLVKDRISGDWTLKDGRLVSPLEKWARLQLPCVPPEEYDLEAVVTRVEADDCLMLGLVYQGQQCQVVLDGGGGKNSWMEVRGGGHGVTPFGITFFQGQVFAQNRPARLQVAVRKARLSVTVDTFRILDYVGDKGPLYIAEHWEAPDLRTLYIGAYETVFTMDNLRLTPVQGTAAFLR